MHDPAYEPAAWYVASAAMRLYLRLTLGRLRCLPRFAARVAWRIYCRFD